MLLHKGPRPPRHSAIARRALCHTLMQGPFSPAPEVALVLTPRQRRWMRVVQVAGPLIVLAALALIVVLWTGLGAPFDGTLHRVRLPWASGPAGPIHYPYGYNPRFLEPWPTGLGVTVFAALVASAVWLLVLERGRHVRYAPSALFAALLYLGGGLWLSRAADAHSSEADWWPPTFAAWRTVPRFIGPSLALFGASCASALWALVSIARAASRGERRAGLVFAITPLVLSLWALMWIDRGFLAPPHAQPRLDAPPIELPMALHAHYWYGWDEVPHVVELWPGATDGARWRAGLTAWVAETPRAPIRPPGKDEIEVDVPTSPDGCVFVRADARLGFGDVRPLLAEVVRRGVWKVALVTAGPMPHSASRSYFVLQLYLPLQDLALQTDATPSQPWIELLAEQGGAPARVRRGDREWSDVDAYTSDLEKQSSETRESSIRLRIDDDVPWASVVHLLDALRDPLLVQFDL